MKNMSMENISFSLFPCLSVCYKIFVDDADDRALTIELGYVLSGTAELKTLTLYNTQDITMSEVV